MLVAIAFLSFPPVNRRPRMERIAYLRYRGLDRSFEQLRWRTRMPFAIIRVKLKARQVAEDTRHRHGTVTPWWAESEVKFVVLHILIALDTSLVPRKSW